MVFAFWELGGWKRGRGVGSLKTGITARDFDRVAVSIAVRRVLQGNGEILRVWRVVGALEQQHGGVGRLRHRRFQAAYRSRLSGDGQIK
ncbi:hypothetical protein [Kingella oralis]|uniref:hypothetical protein n=1 Tax=Kingella oralis TaxID=505 RepID=UPI002D80882A|nr:hypothetical protein [Kingella oralis]